MKPFHLIATAAICTILIAANIGASFIPISTVLGIIFIIAGLCLRFIARAPITMITRLSSIVLTISVSLTNLAQKILDLTASKPEFSGTSQLFFVRIIPVELVLLFITFAISPTLFHTAVIDV